MGRLEVIHAVNDLDISFHQTEMICQRMFSGQSRECIDGSTGADVLDIKEEGRPRVRFEILKHGGEYLQDLHEGCILTTLLTQDTTAS